MLGALFPDNLSTQGPFSRIALALFVPVLVIKTVMAFNFSGANPFVSVADVLRTVDGVPLDQMPKPAVDQILAAAHAWGVALSTLCLFAWIVIFRYRTALPLAIGLILLEQVWRTGAGAVAALRLVAAGGSFSMAAMINLTLSGLLIAAALASLTLVRRKTPIANRSPGG